MIVTLLPVIVMLVSLPDPIVVVLFRAINSDVILMILLLSILTKAVYSEEHAHSPCTQHSVLSLPLLLLTVITLLCTHAHRLVSMMKQINALAVVTLYIIIHTVSLVLLDHIFLLVWVGKKV